jgi:hypothetical protein
VTRKQRDKPPTARQRRELQVLIIETERLLRLLGEDPDGPVDLVAIIAKGQSALAAVLASEQQAEHLRLLQRLTSLH